MRYEVNLHLSRRTMFAVLGGLAFLWLLFHATHILVVLFIAILLATSVSSAVGPFERLGVKRGISILLIYLLVLAGLVGLIALLVPLLVSEAGLLQKNLPEYEKQANVLLARLPAARGATPTVNSILSGLTGEIQSTAVTASGAAVKLGSDLVTLLLIFVIAYFLAVDSRFTQRLVERFLPPRARARAGNITSKMGLGLGYWVRAQLLLALFFGLAFGLGMFLLRVPYALTLGVVGGVLEIIPYVGGFVTIALAVLVALTTGKLWLVAAVVVWYLIVLNLEAHIVAPKLVGGIVGLHPLVVVLALFLGAETLGIIGALLAVPLAVVVQILLDEFWTFPQVGPVDTLDEEGAVPMQPGIVSADSSRTTSSAGSAP